MAGAHWASGPAATPLGLRIMIRPRGGSFVFDADEVRAMMADVRRIAALSRQMSEFTRPQRVGGAGPALPPAVDLGFVVGALTEEHTIDRGCCACWSTSPRARPSPSARPSTSRAT